VSPNRVANNIWQQDPSLSSEEIYQNRRNPVHRLNRNYYMPVNNAVQPGSLKVRQSHMNISN